MSTDDHIHQTLRWAYREPPTNMKLSDAIRLGSTLRPQSYGQLLDSDGASCAAGAALDAIGKLHTHSLLLDLCWYFPIATAHVHGVSSQLAWPIPQPADRVNLAHWITFLNDQFQWSRESIADFVEEFEKRHAAGRQDKEETQEEALA